MLWDDDNLYIGESFTWKDRLLGVPKGFQTLRSSRL